MCDWESEQQAAFEQAKILEKQIKALGIPQVRLPLEIDVFVTPRDMECALWQRQQKERVSLGFWSQLWKGKNI